MPLAAPSQEKAYKLSQAMLDALQLAADSPGAPVYMAHGNTSAALVKRGFIVQAMHDTQRMYSNHFHITPRGRIALKIYQREA